MWHSKVDSEEFFSANRWTVSFFAKNETEIHSGFPIRLLREVVSERRGSVDPQRLGDVEINYLGLENVLPQTGELIEFEPCKSSKIKSRSKIFCEGDVLFGRLRPELNKVFLAEGNITEGVCSGEFIVLIADKKIILPRYLRHILASRYITQFASKYKSGASLPRMGTDDLLGINIPVPPLDVQKKFVQELKVLDEKLVELRAKVKSLPIKTTEALLQALEARSSRLAMKS